MELLRRQCPVCHSADIHYHAPYATKNHGSRVMDPWAPCPACFSETKNTLLEGVKTPVRVLWHVVQARPAGLGCKAAARTVEKAKNTILAWARTVLALQQVLLLEALVQACFA